MNTGTMNLSCQPLLDRITHIADKSGFLTKFKGINNLQDKIRLCLSDERLCYKDCTDFNINNEVCQLLSALYDVCRKDIKSQEVAEEWKKKGSKAYVRKKDEEAFNCYSDGLRFSPVNSSIIPLLFANRSAALFQLQQYKECLVDIERAESKGYPLSPQYKKLLTRKFDCLKKLGHKAEALNSLQQLKEKEISWSTIDTCENENFLNDLEQQLKDLVIKIDPNSREKKEEHLFNGESESVRGMSSNLDIRQNDEAGRHIVASNAVPKGSVVFKERPFASILLPEFFRSHCQQCYTSLLNPIYCDSCSSVIWCDDTCKNLGQKFHKYECAILPVVTGVGIAHLALRIVLIAGWDQCYKVRNELESSCNFHKRTDFFCSNDEASQYGSVYSLLTHINEAVPEDQLQYAIAAIILSKSLLDRSDFFKDQMEKSRTWTECEVEPLVELSSMIMHHIAQLISNAHAITQVEESPPGQSSVSSVEQSRVASAIYPSASLMNHSCIPNIINSFDKNELIIHSIQDIAKGEQVFNCYGPHAHREERSDRLATLRRQYFFKCKCEACVQEKYLRRESSWNGIICEKCNGISTWKEGDDHFNESGLISCADCQLTYQPSETLVNNCSSANQLFQEGEEHFSKDQLDEAEKKLREAVRLGRVTYTKENQFLNSITDTFAKILASKGKYEEAVTVLSGCVLNVSSRFGQNSVEMAHELVKYSDLLLVLKESHPKKKELISVLPKIREIFSVHYGSDWKNYLKMDNL